MAGVALAVGTVAVAATLAVGCAAAGAASAVMVRVAGIADAAALAAADAASGVVAGEPCARAADIADRGGGTLIGCAVEGMTATVAVALPVGPLRAHAQSRAGPPP